MSHDIQHRLQYGLQIGSAFTKEDAQDALLEIDTLRTENDKLRGMIAYGPMPCVYCGLPKADLMKCAHGFPGCARADDMVMYERSRA